MVLRNISLASLNLSRLTALIQRFSHDYDLPLTLSNFLEMHPHIQIEELYKRGSWTSLVARATENEVQEASNEAVAKAYSRAINTRLLACDSFAYFHFLETLCGNGFELTAEMDRRMALMCHYDFWQKEGSKSGFSTLEQSLKALDKTGHKAELLDLLCLLKGRICHEQKLLPSLIDVPLQLHARYTREQILVGFGASSFEKKSPSREGVLLLKETNIELLFVTLNKNEKQFSPATMYHDYAINEELFHWQTQNSARPDRGKGLDYIEHQKLGRRLFLFVREQSKDEYGRTMGFVNFGEVVFVSHTGSQPMSITWQLKATMPSFMWKDAAKLAVG